MKNHPNWFDASYISWISYDSLNIELPEGYLFFAPIVNWGRYRIEGDRYMMPVSVRLNHAIADGYLVAKVFMLIEKEKGLGPGCIEADGYVPEWAQSGRCKIHACSREHERARHMYEPFGFVEIGHIPKANKYDDGIYADDIFMVKDLRI